MKFCWVYRFSLCQWPTFFSFSKLENVMNVMTTGAPPNIIGHRGRVFLMPVACLCCLLLLSLSGCHSHLIFIFLFFCVLFVALHLMINASYFFLCFFKSTKNVILFFYIESVLIIPQLFITYRDHELIMNLFKFLHRL